MNTAWLRLAYTFEFLVATVAVFTLWSQIGGQGHLDMMAWYIKLVLGVGMSLAIVRMTGAAVEHERTWNHASLLWFALILTFAAAMAAVTIYYHVNESNEEQDDEGTTAMTQGPVISVIPVCVRSGPRASAACAPAAGSLPPSS